MIAEKIHNDNVSQLNVRIAHLSQHDDDDDDGKYDDFV